MRITSGNLRVIEPIGTEIERDCGEQCDGLTKPAQQKQINCIKRTQPGETTTKCRECFVGYALAINFPLAPKDINQ